jgi:AcrR family transcriptional regulator
MGGDRAYHHGDLARALVEAALARLRVGGRDAVALRRVAADVGVSPAAAYHHYAGKDALLSAVAAEGERRFAAALQAGLDGVRGDDADPVRSRLRALGRAYLRFAAEEPDLLRLVFDPVHAEACLDPARGSAALLRGCVEDLARAGRSSLPVDQAATLAWSAVHGFADLQAAGAVPAAGADDLLGAVLDALVAPR